jgi:Tol biopolymer transport system component
MAVLGTAALLAGLLILPDVARAPSAVPTISAGAAGTAVLALPAQSETSTATASPASTRAVKMTMPAAAGPDTTAASAALSPTPRPTPMGGSRWIAFASDRGGSVQVWIMDAENPENRRQITDIAGGACQPAWSPDGEKIAFTSPCQGPSQFYIGANIKLVDINSRVVTDLELPKNTFDPAWSPDGGTLLYTALVIEQTELHALSLADGQVRVLSQRGNKNVHAAWSRDGAHVVFVTSDITRRDALWMIGREGDSPEIINEAAIFSEPVFSPDGSHILAAVHHGSNVPYLALVARDDPTMAETRLLHESYAQRHPSFSPDGRWVVFWSEVTPSGKGEILIIDLAAPAPAEARPLTTNNQRDFQPAWSP